MLKYKMACSDRKILVTRIGQMTGTMPRYTYVPRCAYVIGAYAVEKNGDLVVSENEVDLEMIRQLQQDGLIVRNDGQELPSEPTASDIPRSDEQVVCMEDGLEQAGESADVEQAPDAPAVVAEFDTEAVPAERTVSADDTEFPMDASICVPLTRHTGTTLRNLINLLYSRGPLVSKAVGGAFRVEKTVVDALEEANPIRAEDVKKCIADHGDCIRGFRMEEDSLVFDGFAAVPDAEHLQTYIRLVTMMNQMALNQKRIQAKCVDDSNERYALRIWLIRLGMSGDEFKADRKLLMENLSGHTAFRTPEAQEKAKQKLLRQKEQEATPA